MRKTLLSSLALSFLFPVIASAAGLQATTTAAGGIHVIIDGKAITFVDVSPSAWFATYIHDAAQAGIVNGYKDARGNLTGKFGPGNRVTIAEALKIAVEGAGYDADVYGSVVASGVRHWSSKYVSVAKGEHFAMFSGNVNLDRAASRAEVASMFTSAFRVNIDASPTLPYSDVDATMQFRGSIAALSRDGVVSGDTDVNGKMTGMFRPNDAINRAEVVKIVMGARAKYGEPGKDRAPSVVSQEANLVTYTATNAGFSPTVLHVKVGTTVMFKNMSNEGLWVASNPHPVHTGLPGLDARKSYGNGEVYMFTFTKIGTFGYHNHLHPEMMGTIVVE